MTEPGKEVELYDPDQKKRQALSDLAEIFSVLVAGGPFDKEEA